MADKDIIIKYTVEGADEAVKRYEQVQQKAAELKQTLLSLLKEGGKSVRELGVLAKSLEETLAKAAKVGPSGLPIPKGGMGAANEEIKIMREGMTEAVKQIRVEQTALSKETSQQAKIRTDLEAQTQVQVKASAQAAAEYARITKQGYGAMSESAKQYGIQVQAVKQQIQQISSQTGQTFQQAGQQLAASGTPINQVNQALKELQVQTKSTGTAFTQLGNIAKFVFAGVLGISVIGILRNVVEWLKGAATSGIELVRAMYQLELGVRAIQRAGMNVTIKDIYENIDILREKFRIFTTKELIVGTAALINLTRDFGFTKKQIVELQDAIVTLAIVNGRAMDDVQRTVALALSSGYTEGLQRLGVSINRVTIAQKAGTLGYGDNYLALTELQRAEASRLILLEKVAKYDKDVAEYYKSEPGRIDTATTAWKEFTNVLGQRAVPIFALLSDWLVRLTQGIASLLGLLAISGSAVGAFFTALKKSFTFTDPKTFFDDFKAAYDEAFMAANKRALPDIFPKDMLGDTDVINQDLARIENAVGDSLDKLLEYQNKYTEESENLNADYWRDLEKIDREGARNREELRIDHEVKLARIEADALRDIAEENSKYALDVAQTIRQFEIRKAELQAQYRENEKKAEIKFQEELRKLREGFLFDLEDALHERDARQILRLIRQYNLQKDQTTRQYEIDKEERAREYKLQLEELEIQRAERLRIMAEEHAARIAAIQQQAAYERALEEQNFRLAQEEQTRRLEEQKEERRILLEQQKADLAAEKENILKQMGEDLWTDLQIKTEEGLNNLYKALLSTLGPGGDADKVFQYYKGAMAGLAQATMASIGGVIAAITAMSSIRSSMVDIGATISNVTSGGNAPPPSGGGNQRQSGGTVRKGEVYKVHKDETFIPAVNGNILSKQQSQEALVNDMGRGARMGDGGNGRATIEVLLQPGLIARVIDDALDQTADIIIRQMRGAS